MSEEQEKRTYSRQQQLEEKETAGSFNMADVGAVAAAQLLLGLHPSSFTELQLDGWMRGWMKAKLSHCIQGNLLDLLDNLRNGLWLKHADRMFLQASCFITVIFHQTTQIKETNQEATLMLMFDNSFGAVVIPPIQAPVMMFHLGFVTFQEV